jgi:hypothetical protein
MRRKRYLVALVVICVVLGGGAAFGGVSVSDQRSTSLVASHSEKHRTRGRVALRRAPILRHQIHPFKALHDPVGTKNQALRMAAAALSASLSPGAGSAKAASLSAEPNPSESTSGSLHMVYENSNVSAGLLPTARALCFVEVVSEISSSVCTTNPDVSSGLGLALHTAGEYRLVGVLPEGATGLTVEETGGATIEVPLNTENGYSFATKVTPITMRVTNSNSTAYSVPLNGPKTPTAAASESPATTGG